VDDLALPAEHVADQRRVAALLVGLDGQETVVAHQRFRAAERPPARTTRSVGSAAETGQFLGSLPAVLRLAMSGRDGCGLGPDDEARALLDHDRHGKRSQRAHALEGLDLVELQDRADRKWLLEIEVQAPQVSSDLARLELEAAATEPQQS
jgi:hypothetical protein